MKRHIAICDIDGTLLNTSKSISDKTLNELIQWQLEGNLLILASGRPTSGMLVHAHTLKMEKYGGLLISSNGACVVDVKTQNTLWEKFIDHNTASDVLKHLESFNVIPMIAQGNYLFVNDVFNNTINLEGQTINIIEYESRGGGYKLKEYEHLSESLDSPLYKILVAGDPYYLKEYVSEISQPFNNCLTSTFTAPFYYEFTDKGIDKAKALHFIIETLNLSHDNTIAFGDGDNDYTLLESCRVGIAMSNATPRLKSIASMITLSNNEDGIAHALKLYKEGAL